jgi:CPA1 family monovalent cation:H+ antiporter
LKAALVQESLFIFMLLVALVAFAIVAKRFAIPYPIAFVIGGVCLALIPNVPHLRLRPEWILFIILPPLLYAGGWFTDWKLFRANLRTIGLLAIGLVVATTAAVALLAHALVPELSWAAAIALGAIVSPPDAVAAGAVFERFSVPRRVVAVLDGEGLVNDATALVIYRFAVAAAVTGTFSPGLAGIAFVLVAAGGVAIGLAFTFAYVNLMRLLRKSDLTDYQLDNVLAIVVPYACYLSAESLHVSGVLATVTAGIAVSRQSSRIFTPQGRLVAYSVWDLLIFLLNGLVFFTIGLELPHIVQDPEFLSRGIWIGAAISVLVIVVRIVWVFPAAYIPRWLSPKLRAVDPVPSWRFIFIVAWSGMRGIVSVAAALALPMSDAAGNPFPGRDVIIFVTFCVIFATLVFQGLSLIPIIKWLGLSSGEDLEQREIDVRVAALRAAVRRMRELEKGFTSTEEWEIEGRILAEYEYRIKHLLGHGAPGEAEMQQTDLQHRLESEALAAERVEIARLRESGEIPDEIYRLIEYDLDLADARLN